MFESQDCIIVTAFFSLQNIVALLLTDFSTLQILRNHYPVDAYHIIGMPHTHRTLPNKWQSIAVDTSKSRNLHCSEGKKV